MKFKEIMEIIDRENQFFDLIVVDRIVDECIEVGTDEIRHALRCIADGNQERVINAGVRAAVNHFTVQMIALYGEEKLLRNCSVSKHELIEMIRSRFRDLFAWIII